MPYIYEYPRAALTVDIILFTTEYNEHEVLLIRRRFEPFKDCWAFPGGFVEIDEEIDDAAKRELEEETSVTNVELHQFKTVGTIGRDPRGRTVSVVYIGKAKKDEIIIKGGSDAAEARFFSINKLPEIAFDHREILQQAISVYLY